MINNKYLLMTQNNEILSCFYSMYKLSNSTLVIIIKVFYDIHR